MRNVTLSGMFVLLAGCGSADLSVSPDDGASNTTREHDLRFVGRWVVEHPTNAQFVATFYDFGPDGTLSVGSSTYDCTVGLASDCVTGVVAENIPTATVGGYQHTTCYFGDEWSSLSPSHLVIVGDCSDGQARNLLLGFNEDSSSNSGGGAGASLLSVDNNTEWSFSPIDPIFRKCPDGADETACAAEVRPF